MTGGMYLKGVTQHNHKSFLPNRLCISHQEKDAFLNSDEDEEEEEKEEEVVNEKGLEQSVSPSSQRNPDGSRPGSPDVGT